MKRSNTPALLYTLRSYMEWRQPCRLYQLGQQRAKRFQPRRGLCAMDVL